jgi:hypothetical protein
MVGLLGSAELCLVAVICPVHVEVGELQDGHALCRSFPGNAGNRLGESLHRSII